MDISILPTINAILNASSAILLTSGYYFIKKQKDEKAHKICMLSACGTSTLFLMSYLYYHAHHGMTRYAGRGIIRLLYFSILLTHTILAVVIVPLILTVLFWAFKGQFNKHRMYARITFPLWMYVSVTGVVIYWMLYQVIW